MIAPDYSHFVENGLNLIAVFDLTTLPSPVRGALDSLPLEKYQRMVLVGNGGGDRLWAAMQRHGMSSPDPIDHFSIELARQFVATQCGGAAARIVYPLTQHLVPLQQLGALAGWHHDSPLGLGIHNTYGVWFAYRVAFLVDAPLPLKSEPPTPSPCDSCLDKPCITRCPVGAVRGIGRFDVPTCGKHRIAAGSGCSDRCLSRLACPIGTDYRYPMAQIQYHYSHSIATLQQWYGKDYA